MANCWITVRLSRQLIHALLWRIKLRSKDKFVSDFVSFCFLSVCHSLRKLVIEYIHGSNIASILQWKVAWLKIICNIYIEKLCFTRRRQGMLPFTVVNLVRQSLAAHMSRCLSDVKMGMLKQGSVLNVDYSIKLSICWTNSAAYVVKTNDKK